MTAPTLAASTMSTTEQMPPGRPEPVQLPACESCEQNAATVRVIWPDGDVEAWALSLGIPATSSEFLVCSDPGCCPPGLLVLQVRPEADS